MICNNCGEPIMESRLARGDKVYSHIKSKTIFCHKEYLAKYCTGEPTED